MTSKLFDSRIDLSSGITNEDVIHLNAFGILSKIVKEYLNTLNSPFGKTESKVNRDKSVRDIIIKHYGIEGRIFSSEEISLWIGKTKERVRQLIGEFGLLFHELINDENKDHKIKKPVEIKIRELNKSLSNLKIISKRNLEDRYLPSMGINLNNDDKIVSTLFYEIFDFRIKSPSGYYLDNNTFLFIDNSISIDDFFDVCYLIYIFLEKNMTAAEIEDIVIDVRRKRKTISNELIEIAYQELEEIESVKSNNKIKYQVKFQFLSSAKDKAYRILNEKGEFIKLAEIIKTANHLLLKSEKNKRVTTSLASQLAGDYRFTSQGKTGYWGLAEWQGSNETLYELITNTLTHFDRPLTMKEMLNYIQITRPKVPTKSIFTYLYDKTKYLKLEYSTFILKEWEDLYKDQIINTKRTNNYVKENPIKEQIKQQIIQILQKNNSKEMYLKNYC